MERRLARCRSIVNIFGNRVVPGERKTMECKSNILIVEDTAEIREYLCHVLQNAGFEVCGCEDGASALDAAKESIFQVIIIDYCMPNISGADATRRLRERFPVSFIIGVSSNDKKEDFLAAGADAFLLKPYRSVDIINLINGSNKLRPRIP